MTIISEATVTTKVLGILQDAAATALWSSAEVRQGIDDALITISEYSPRLVQATVAFAGTAKELSLSSLTDMMDVDMVEFPIDYHPKRYINFSVRGSSAILDTYEPAVSTADTAYIWYTTPHVISGTATNSLGPREQNILYGLAAGECAISKAVKLYQEANGAITTIATAGTAVGNMSNQILNASTALLNGSTALGLMPSLILSAGTAIALVNAQVLAATAALGSGGTALALASPLILQAGTALASVDAAILSAGTAITSGTTLINTITEDETPQTDWINTANAFLSKAAGFLSEANGYISQASGDENVAEAYGALAVRDLGVATGFLNEANGYISLANSDRGVAEGYDSLAARDLSVAGQYLGQASGYFSKAAAQFNITSHGRYLENWGQAKVSNAIARLAGLAKPNFAIRYPDVK